MRRWHAYALAAVTGVMLVAPAVAQAAYWNVWQNNLPDGAGNRAKFGDAGPNNVNAAIRMQWTTGSHHMMFTLIENNGTWNNFDTTAWGEPNGGDNFDRILGYINTNDWSKAGCHNPSGLSTFWVNCRAATTV